MKSFGMTAVILLLAVTSCKALRDRSQLLGKGSFQEPSGQPQTDNSKVRIILQDTIHAQKYGGPVNMNPYLTNNEAVLSMSRFVYEPLAVYNSANPFIEPPTPLLAKKIEWEDQFSSLVITVRKGVKFQQLSGAALRLTAEDEKSFSLGRGSGQEPRKPINYRSANFTFGSEYELTADDVEFSLLVAAHINTSGANTWLSGTYIRVIRYPNDPYKLKITWNKPGSLYERSDAPNWVLAYKILSTPILPRRGLNYEYRFDWSSPQTDNFKNAFSQSRLSRQMWGTGPYQFTSNRPDFYTNQDNQSPSIHTRELEKNPGYWGNQETAKEQFEQFAAQAEARKAASEEAKKAASEEGKDKGKAKKGGDDAEDKSAPAEIDPDVFGSMSDLVNQLAQNQSNNPASALPFDRITFYGSFPYTVGKSDLLEEKNEFTVSHLYAPEAPSVGRVLKSSGGDFFPTSTHFTYFLLFNFKDPEQRDDYNFSSDSFFRSAVSQAINRQQLAANENAMGLYDPGMSFFSPGLFSSRSMLPQHNPVDATRNFVRVDLLTDSGKHFHDFISANVYGNYKFFMRFGYFHKGANFISSLVSQDIRNEVGGGFSKKQKYSSSIVRRINIGLPSMNSSPGYGSSFDAKWRRDLIVKRIRTGGFHDPRPFWHSKGTGNSSGFKSDAVDGLIDQLHTIDDPNRFVSIFQRIDDQLKRDLPALPLVHAKDAIGVSSMANVYFKDDQLTRNNLFKVLGWD